MREQVCVYECASAAAYSWGDSVNPPSPLPILGGDSVNPPSLLPILGGDSVNPPPSCLFLGGIQ